MIKFKRIKGFCKEDPRIMGQCQPSTGLVELFPDVIKQEADRSGSSVRDLTALVKFHEEAHYLHKQNRVGEFMPNLNEVEEQMADEYATKKFYQLYHRQPRVNCW